MRALALVAILLAVPFVGLAMPVASAQAAPLLTDPAGDAAIVVAGAVRQQVGGAREADSADLLELSILEEEDILALSLKTAAVPQVAGTRYHISFSWNRVNYRASFFPHFDTEVRAATFCLYLEADWWEVVECSPAIVDASASTWGARIGKPLLLDRQDRVPGKGDRLTGWAVTSEATIFGITGIVSTRIADRMPDDVETAVDYVLLKGDDATGHISLRSSDRVRLSNGASTTFVFRTTVRNAADFEDAVSLAVVGLPDGWSARVQTPVRVPAKTDREVPILISVPFAHEHGGYTPFNVTAKSDRNPQAVARIGLGVQHTSIPQPTGHHPDLYLHGTVFKGPFALLFPFTPGFMNTLETLEEDPEDITSGRRSGSSTGTTFWFDIPLNPSLALGLDFDTLRTGTLDLGIRGGPPGGARVTATLAVRPANGDWRGDDDLIIAEADPATVDLDPQGAVKTSLTIVPLPESDYVPYAKGQTLLLRVGVTSTTPSLLFLDAFEPSLVTRDFKMTLPLEEYHDRLSAEAEAMAGLSLVAQGAVERVGAPGSTLTYTFALRPEGQGGLFVIDVAGTDAARGAVTPAGAVRLEPGTTRVVTLAVRIPADSAPGQEFEVLLFVHDQEDPSRMAVARTKTTVVAAGVAEAAPDEEQVFLSAQENERETPGPALALLVVAALLATGIRRRRHA